MVEAVGTKYGMAENISLGVTVTRATLRKEDCNRWHAGGRHELSKPLPVCNILSSQRAKRDHVNHLNKYNGTEQSRISSTIWIMEGCLKEAC